MLPTPSVTSESVETRGALAAPLRPPTPAVILGPRGLSKAEAGRARPVCGRLGAALAGRELEREAAVEAV